MQQQKKRRKEYLGDGVYIDSDGYQLILTTDTGLNVTNTIYLDAGVVRALIAYLDRTNSEGEQ